MFYRKAAFIILSKRSALRTIELDKTDDTAVDFEFEIFIDALMIKNANYWAPL